MTKELVDISFKCCICGKNNTKVDPAIFCECKKVKLRYCKICKKHYQYVCGSNHDCPDCEWRALVARRANVAPTIPKKCPSCVLGGGPEIGKGYVSFGTELVCHDCLRHTNANTTGRIQCHTCRTFQPMEVVFFRRRVHKDKSIPVGSLGAFFCSHCLAKDN